MSFCKLNAGDSRIWVLSPARHSWDQLAVFQSDMKISCLIGTTLVHKHSHWPTQSFVIIQSNVSRFSKFFHSQISKEIVYDTLVKLPPNLKRITIPSCEVLSIQHYYPTFTTASQLTFYVKFNKTKPNNNSMTYATKILWQWFFFSFLYTNEV